LYKLLVCYSIIILHSSLTIRGLCRAPSMSLTLADVKRIAHLAQLDMDDNHAAIALGELNGIFALAEQMQAIDTEGVAPLSQPLAAVLGNLPLRLRDDVVTESNHREAYQASAPATADGLYLVPKVIE
jgi:aspartyl-tRNA(Asn)/glutamyl-tRNA(Gln) amidotransferase subunit C